MKIAIHGRVFSDRAFPHAQYLFDELRRHGAEVIIYRPFAKMLHSRHISCGDCAEYESPAETEGTDLFISIGGDGTLLDAVTFIGSREIPVLGVNAGRLGFMATTPAEGIKEVLQPVLDGNYTIDSRSLLRLESDEDLFEGMNFALNEFTITKRDTSSMILVHTYLNDEFLNSYWADGLIVSTPTGATGYSLSCGGPLVMPDSGNFVITPVSPHNLSVRPIVVPDSSVLSFRIEGRSKRFLVSLDSRSKSVKATARLTVRKENFSAKLIKLEGDTFMRTLRNKLNWGFDVRN
ncbi:MAG: NAD kinase [Bacteroidota bacterium]